MAKKSNTKSEESLRTTGIINLWPGTGQKVQIGMSPDEESDQPVNPCSLIRDFAVHMKNYWDLDYPKSA